MIWRLFFRVAYRVLRALDPLLRAAWRRSLPPLGPVVDLRVPGRRSGRERRTLVTLLRVGDAWYVGHPNGPAGWTRNLAAADRASVLFANGTRGVVAPTRLYGGPEREGVIRATWSQQPFPANLLYTAARRHVRSAGVYFRLNPVDADDGRPAGPV